MGEDNKVSLLSPLRYPGAKRRFAPFVDDLLRLNNLKPKLFVEPFAGSLSVSLRLLQWNSVEKIGIGEADPLIASFWKTVFFDTNWLKKTIWEIPVTLDKWNHFRNGHFNTHRQRALACIFLNRTSFSGIISVSAGPIGGHTQKSKYKIDCRFNKETICNRLDRIAMFKSRVLFIENKKWEETLIKSKTLKIPKSDIFFYLDPPFYFKADKLYRYYFSDEDHQKLHDTIMNEESPWLLSYDPADAIIDKYTKNGDSPRRLGFLYSAARQSVRTETQELVITNLPSLPQAAKAVI